MRIKTLVNDSPQTKLGSDTGVEGRSAEFQEPLDLRSNPFQGGGDDAILPPKGIE